MTAAFWDTSGLVPCCVQQKSSAVVEQLLEEHSIIVWWATPVELRSALERLRRMGELTAPDFVDAEVGLGYLRGVWREVQPSDALRDEAERFLKTYALRAADSMQLAAAWMWAEGSPQARPFISGDAQLLEAARRVGFRVVAV